MCLFCVLSIDSKTIKAINIFIMFKHVIMNVRFKYYNINIYVRKLLLLLNGIYLL